MKILKKPNENKKINLKTVEVINAYKRTTV